MNGIRIGLLVCAMPFLIGGGCEPAEVSLLSDRRQIVAQDGLELVARFVHLTDTHIVDEESPARFTGAHSLVSSAWREWESYSTQLLDGTIRAANRIHASGRTIDFLIHTGDACDNVQQNELEWFMTVMEGGLVNPASGPDDRPIESRPEPWLDPHAPFAAQGLYQHSVHGELPSIPWYALLGNHDVYALGVFPISMLFDERVAVLPLQPRLGVFLPSVLNPTGSFTHGRITPANPGPPELFSWPVPVVPSAERAYFSNEEFIARLQLGRTSPTGHGFAAGGPPWYSVSPVPGLRLIGLFTSDRPNVHMTAISHDGCISAEQLDWFIAELEAASSRGETIIVASHHPSGTLEPLYGTAIDADGFRELLNAYPAVVLHLAGHLHRNRVTNRGGYLEIETCSTLDWPLEARLVEIWRNVETGAIVIGYEMFSHLADDLPPRGDDPLAELRLRAHELAGAGRVQPSARMIDDFLENTGTEADRSGLVPIQP